MESTFEHFGRIDILVNAEAGNFLALGEDLSPNGFRTGLALFHSMNPSICVLTSSCNFFNSSSY